MRVEIDSLIRQVVSLTLYFNDISPFGIRVCKEPAHHAVHTHDLYHHPRRLITTSTVSLKQTAQHSIYLSPIHLPAQHHLATNAIHLSANEGSQLSQCPSNPSSTTDPKQSYTHDPFYALISVSIAHTRRSDPIMEGTYHSRGTGEGKQVSACYPRPRSFLCR
jgi:hypothetical protein